MRGLLILEWLVLLESQIGRATRVFGAEDACALRLSYSYAKWKEPRGGCFGDWGRAYRTGLCD